MEGEVLRLLPAVASGLALVLSLVNLFLQRRDRHPRLRIRVRYEYRAGGVAAEGGREDTLPQIHDDSQEGLYLRLGDFMREYALEYPQGSPVVRFALSNEGEKSIYLDGVRLVLRAGVWPFGERLVVDPTEDSVVPYELSRETANAIRGRKEREGPLELVPGDGVGYKFELIRLAGALEREGYRGNLRLVLEATDRLGATYRRRFRVSTDLWAQPR